MHEPLLTVLLVGGASAVATIAFFGAITVFVRDSLFPENRLVEVVEDYATPYFGRVQ